MLNNLYSEFFNLYWTPLQTLPLIISLQGAFPLVPPPSFGNWGLTPASALSLRDCPRISCDFDFEKLHFRFTSVPFTPLSGTLYTYVWYPLHLCLVPFTPLSGTLYTSVWYPLQLCLVTFTPLSGTLYTSVW